MRQKHATCDKIALCKRAYLCDVRLLHAVAGKLKSFNHSLSLMYLPKPRFNASSNDISYVLIILMIQIISHACIHAIHATADPQPHSCLYFLHAKEFSVYVFVYSGWDIELTIS